MEEPHLISHAAIPQRLGRYISEWEWAVCTFLMLNSQSIKRGGPFFLHAKKRQFSALTAKFGLKITFPQQLDVRGGY